MSELPPINEVINDIETGSILDYKFDNGFPIWLIMKTSCIDAIHNKLYNTLSPYSFKKRNLLGKILQKIVTTIVNLCKLPFIVKHVDICFESSHVGRLKKNDRFINRLGGYFYTACKTGRKIIFETGGGLELDRKEKVYSLDFIENIAFICAKVFKKKSNFKEYYDYMELKLSKYNLPETFWLRFKSHVEFYNSYVYFYMVFFKIVPKVIRSKIYIINNAMYSINLLKVYVLNQNGIITCDLQHGYVGEDHVAYWYNPSLIGKLVNYFPNYFLSLGEFWHSRISIPSKKIAIGYPHLENSIKSQELCPEKPLILIISGGCYNYSEILIWLMQKCSTHNIVFKPHPVEIHFLKERYNKILDQIEIDFTKNNYNMLKRCSIVLSKEHSTMLFEALAFDKKVVYVNDDIFFPELFKNIKTITDFNINDNSIGRVSEQMKRCIWKINPIDNMDQFLAKVLNT